MNPHATENPRSPNSVTALANPAEQVQDAIVIAAALLISARKRGKKVSAGNITYYAVKLLKQGRRSTGQSKTDAMAPATQLAGRSSVVSIIGALMTKSVTLNGNFRFHYDESPDRLIVHPPILSPSSNLSGDFALSFPTALSATYVVEYKPVLGGSDWAELTRTNGTGLPMTISDPAATSTARFYRVRVQSK